MKMKGYTYLEVIVVVFIIVISSAIVTFNIKNNKSRNLNIAYLILADDIRYMQRLSMYENREYNLIINNTNSYTISYKLNNVRQIIKSKELQNGVSFSAPKTITYTKRGTPQAGDSLILRSGDYYIDCTILPVSGRIAIASSKLS